jgi:hypothetical protein
MQERFVRKRKIHRLKEEKKKEMSAERFEKIQEDGNKAEHHNILKTLAEAQALKKM